MAKHGGTDHVKGQLHRGTAPKPSPHHGGTDHVKGVVHAPRPQGSLASLGPHGGTHLARALNKRQK